MKTCLFLASVLMVSPLAKAADEKPAAAPRKMSVLAYSLDISRDKVPTMESLFRIVDILAELGYNQFQLYTEHTFAYAAHKEVWQEASPITPDEARRLDDYCAARSIELVPVQNSFGHLERWLCHPGYNHLAECPQGGATVKKWNYTAAMPMTLCPTDPRCLDFLAGLYDELLPCFRSKLMQVHCDETDELMDDLGIGRSAAEIKAKGPTRVYLDFLLKVRKLLADRGHQMIIAGDIILQAPELIGELPEDVITVCWGYEANSPFEEQAAKFEKAGRRFWVSPGTSGWRSITGRTTNMLGNIGNAYRAACRHGAEGILIYEWGDGGHNNPWILSVPGLVYLSNLVKGRTLSREELAAAIDRLLGGTVGQALLEYGDAYLKVHGRSENGTEFYHMLKDGDRYVRGEGVTDESIAAGFAQWHRAKAMIKAETAPEWVRDDLATIDLLCRAVEMRIKEPGKRNFRACFEPEYRRLWLKHNRLGGLKDSLWRLFGAAP